MYCDEATRLRCLGLSPSRTKGAGGWTETLPVLQYKRLSSGPVSQLTISLRDTNGRRLSLESLVDAGGPGSVRKCPAVALADLGDVEGFDRSGEEDQLYAFQLSDGVYKRKKCAPSPWVAKIRRLERR